MLLWSTSPPSSWSSDFPNKITVSSVADRGAQWESVWQPSVKTKLFKNLLHMKFMQRELDSETKKQLEEEEKKIFSEEHQYLDLPELKEKESFITEEQFFV